MSRIATYLDLSYRRAVMGESVDPDSALKTDAEYTALLRSELARIHGLGLGSNLALRDFVSYQHAKAIEAALAKLENKDAAG